MTNEPGIPFEYVSGTEKVGADLLSRPHSRRLKNFEHQSPFVNRVSVWDEISAEHMRGLWGAFENYKALQNRGSTTTWPMVKKVCNLCEICAKLRHRCARADFGKPFSFLIPGQTIYGDVIGAPPQGRRAAMYLNCLVDYATRLGDAKPL